MKNLRKALVLVVAIAVGAVAVPASASTLIAPFFSDAGTLLNPFNTGVTPTSAATTIDGAADRATYGFRGQATFITLSNIGTTTAVVSVTYTDMFGADATPTDNTFEVGVLQSIVFRPVRFDPFMETSVGTALPSTLGTPLVPKALQQGRFVVNDTGGGGNGGVLIETATAGAELAGSIRVFLWGNYGREDQSNEAAPLFRP